MLSDYGRQRGLCYLSEEGGVVLLKAERTMLPV